MSNADLTWFHYGLSLLCPDNSSFFHVELVGTAANHREASASRSSLKRPSPLARSNRASVLKLLVCLDVASRVCLCCSRVINVAPQSSSCLFTAARIGVFENVLAPHFLFAFHASTCRACHRFVLQENKQAKGSFDFFLKSAQKHRHNNNTGRKADPSPPSSSPHNNKQPTTTLTSVLSRSSASEAKSQQVCTRPRSLLALRLR